MCIAERVRDPFRDVGARDQKRLRECRHERAEIGAEPVRDAQRLGRAGEGCDVARMAAGDRRHVGASPVHGMVHRRFKGRTTLAGNPPAVAIEFHQLRLGHEPERAARRDQDPLRSFHARADVAEAFDDMEVI